MPDSECSQPALSKHNVNSLEPYALLVRLDLETDTLSFGQILEARALDGREVYEHIASTIVGFDEAVAALTVEELDRPTHGHRENSTPAMLPPPSVPARRP